MRALILGAAGAVLCLSAAGYAATIREGADPAPQRVIYADPFDFYNQWAYDNNQVWQGGPMPPGSPTGTYPTKAPSNGCGTTTIQNTPSRHQMAREQWATEMACGSIITPAGFATSLGSLEAPFDVNCGGSGEFVTTKAQYISASYTWGTGGSYDSMLMFKHSFKDRIQAMDPTKNSVNGTDANPLVLIFYLADGPNPPGLYPSKDNSYVELSLDADHAPTDYVWRGDRTKNYPDPDGCPNGPFPVICQQVRETNVSTSENGTDLTWLNNNCPPLSTNTWKSFAFGFLSIIDKDPCGILEQGSDPHIPTVDFPAVFDGNKWRQMRAFRFHGLAPGYNTLAPNPPYWYDPNMQLGNPGGSNNFTLAAGTQRVTLKIVTDYVFIYMKNTNGDWHAAVPRVYKGPFNTISWGVAPGCELDKTTGACKVGGTPKQCLTYSSAGNGYNRTHLDSVALYDGELAYSTTDGACCYPNGTCAIQDQLVCQGAGGTFNGQNTTCEAVACCPSSPYVWADKDADGDVDMNDFGKLQQCITGPGGGVPAGCSCFNRDNDNDVDNDDYQKFKDCATGENIPWSMALTPSCVP